MLSIQVMLAVALLAAVAGFSQGLTGFGFALVFTPLASMLLPAREVVLSAQMVGGLVGSLVVLETLRSFRWRRTSPLLLSAAAGAPAGVAMLALLDVNALRVAIAITALSLAIAFLIFRPLPVRREPRLLVVVGAVGGFLNGCTSMGGPPVAMAVANQRWGVAQSRASLAMFNLLSLVAGLGFASLLGMLHGGSWLTAGVAGPAAVAGTIAGTLSARRLSPTIFRKVLVGTVAITAVSSLLAVLLQR